MVSRDEIILEVCENLVHQVNMQVYINITTWHRFRLIAVSAAFCLCIGGSLGSLFGAVLQGGIWGFFIGTVLGVAACENLGVDKKRADEVIRNDLTSKQKSLLIEYVRIFFEGKYLIDAASTLSALSNKEDQEAAIKRSVSIFFRNEMNYIVNDDMDGHPRTFYNDL